MKMNKKIDQSINETCIYNQKGNEGKYVETEREKRILDTIHKSTKQIITRTKNPPKTSNLKTAEEIERIKEAKFY